MPKSERASKSVPWKLTFEIAAGIAAASWVVVFALSNTVLSIAATKTGGTAEGYDMGLRVFIASATSLLLSAGFVAQVVSGSLDD